MLLANPAEPQRDPLKVSRQRGRAGPVKAMPAGDGESKVRWRSSKQISLVPQCQGCLSWCFISFQVCYVKHIRLLTDITFNKPSITHTYSSFAQITNPEY